MVRLKNRYIVVQIIPHKESRGKSFAESGIYKTVIKHVQKHFGCVGLGAVEQGLRIKYCNDETKITFLRCRHRAHRFVTSILPLITVNLPSLSATDFPPQEIFRTLKSPATITLPPNDALEKN